MDRAPSQGRAPRRWRGLLGLIQIAKARVRQTQKRYASRSGRTSPVTATDVRTSRALFNSVTACAMSAGHTAACPPPGVSSMARAIPSKIKD